MTETITLPEPGKLVRETPGRVRWRTVNRVVEYTDISGLKCFDAQVHQVLEQEWTVEVFSDRLNVARPPRTEWREVPTEE